MMTASSTKTTMCALYGFFTCTCRLCVRRCCFLRVSKVKMGRSSQLGRLRKSVGRVYRSELASSDWDAYDGCCLTLDDRWARAFAAVQLTVGLHPMQPVYDLTTSRSTRLSALTRVLKDVARATAPMVVFVTIDDMRWPAKPYWCHQVAVYWSGSKMYFYDPMGPLKSTFYGPDILSSNLSKAVGVRIEFAGRGTGVQIIARHGGVRSERHSDEADARAEADVRSPAALFGTCPSRHGPCTCFPRRTTRMKRSSGYMTGRGSSSRWKASTNSHSACRRHSKHDDTDYDGISQLMSS